MLFVLLDENTNRTYGFNVVDLDPNDWYSWHDKSGLFETMKDIDHKYGGVFICHTSSTAIKYASFYFNSKEWNGITRIFKQYFRDRGYKVK